MTNDHIKDAIAYNKRQPYDEDEIKLIQEVTGSTPDGVWGPRTVQAIAEWQDETLLIPDGKVGPVTFEKVSNEDLCAGYMAPTPWEVGPVTIGVWGDDSPKLMARKTYADRLVELGISEVALMMNRANLSKSADPWDLRWKDTGEEGFEDDIIAEIAENYEARDITISLTTWPQPSKEQIDEMCEAMVSLLQITKAKAFEVDTEGNWHTKHLKDFRNMDLAAEYLVESMRAAIDAAGVPAITEMTTFGHHAEFGRYPTVTGLVDRCLPQGYSTSPRSSGPVAWNTYMAPGRHQKWIYDRVKKAGAKSVAMGLAAYKQRGFVGHTPEEAMQKAYDETVALDIDHIRYWSSKWILGAQSKHAPYAAAHLLDIQK